MWTARYVFTSFAYNRTDMVRACLTVWLYLLWKAWLILRLHWMERDSLMSTWSVYWIGGFHWLEASAIGEPLIHNWCMLERHFTQIRILLIRYHCFHYIFISCFVCLCCCWRLYWPIHVIYFLNRLFRNASYSFSWHKWLPLLEHRHLLSTFRSTTHWVENTIVLVDFVTLSHRSCLSLKVDMVGTLYWILWFGAKAWHVVFIVTFSNWSGAEHNALLAQ